MECQKCQKRQATLHLTNYINAQKTEIHVCQQCAMENGYIDSEDESSYSIQDLLSGLLNLNSSFAQHAERSKVVEKEDKCSSCNLSYTEFVKTGKFGCAHCYESFGKQLNPIFKRVHSGNTAHTGKIPKRQHDRLQQKRYINDYREQMKQLIDAEKFEEAAVVRDKIREIEQKHTSSIQKEGE